MSFWSRIDKNNSCWEWTGGLNTSGYGEIHINKKRYLVHRYSYELHYGPIPEELIICHKCDNKKCVNPDHLMLGTYLDNSLDMKSKGRSKLCSHKGEANGRVILNEIQVKQIIKLLKIGIKGTEIANQFNVNKSTIYGIKKNRRWKHIER